MHVLNPAPRAPTLLLLVLALSGCLQTDAESTQTIDTDPPAAPLSKEWTFQAATAPARHTLHLETSATVTFELSVTRSAGSDLFVDLPGACDDLKPYGSSPTVATGGNGGKSACFLEAGDHELRVSIDGVAEGRLSMWSR